MANNPMMAAIKKRKGSSVMGDHEASHSAEHTDVVQPQSMDKKPVDPVAHQKVKAIIASLQPHEKNLMEQMLDKQSGESDEALKIAQGKPSSEEHQKIAEASQKENQMNQLEDQEEQGHGISEDQSDDIAKSMLDSRHMRGMANDKPRNLGDRMKQSLASKLKAKGKI